MEFYVLHGNSAELAGTTEVSRQASGNASFASLLETRWGPSGMLVAHLVDDADPGGAGPVSLPARVGTVLDNDIDGVYAEIEWLAPGGGDGNRDGIPDSRQADVASIPSFAAGQFVTFDGLGRGLGRMQVSKPAEDAGPLSPVLPYGQFQFELHDVPVGQVTQVRMLLPEGHQAGIPYKPDSQSGEWSPFVFDGETGAVVSGNVVTLFLRDGGRGDADGVANGIILDPVAPSTGEVRLFCSGDLAADGWRWEQSGGSSSGQGTVAFENGDLVIREGDSFLVTLQRDIVIPPMPKSLSFEFTENLDRTDRDFINDAFEVALLDAEGLPVVPTFRPGRGCEKMGLAPSGNGENPGTSAGREGACPIYSQPRRDAYFNLTEGELADYDTNNTHYTGQTLGVDISRLAPGSIVSLVLRLVNDDRDIGSSVTIGCNCTPTARDDETTMAQGQTLRVPAPGVHRQHPAVRERRLAEPAGRTSRIVAHAAPRRSAGEADGESEKLAASLFPLRRTSPRQLLQPAAAGNAHLSPCRKSGSAIRLWLIFHWCRPKKTVSPGARAQCCREVLRVERHIRNIG